MRRNMSGNLGLYKYLWPGSVHFNVMQKSGILSEQELQEHVNTISARNAWGTNVELSMLGALAGVDILVIDCTDTNSTTVAALAWG